MTPEQFCYWLQGRAELLPQQPPSPEEWQAIREHLATVFRKVTPPVVVPSPGIMDIKPLEPREQVFPSPYWPLRVTC